MSRVLITTYDPKLMLDLRAGMCGAAGSNQ
jgi:hypothetical protein